MRDLNSEQDIFDDAVASRTAHASPRNVEVTVGAAAHAGDDDTTLGSPGGEYIKSLVFGGLDGIITTFAIIAASHGGGLSTRTIIVMGFANLLADAISMGFGDFLSETAERKYAAAEQARVQWEMENCLKVKVSDMTEIYERRGMISADACAYVAILARYPTLFLETTMVDDVGLMPCRDGDDPHEAAKKGLVTSIAFIAFGLVPVLVYVAYFAASGGSPSDEGAAAFHVAIAATAVTLFALGAAKAWVTKQAVIASGLWMLVNGGLAAMAAYLVGHGLDAALKEAGVQYGAMFA